MITSWLKWVLWILLILALTIFTNAAGAVFLLMIVVIVPLVCMAANKIAASRLEIAVAFPETLEKEQRMQGIFKAKNSSLAPCGMVEAVLASKNMLTGEENAAAASFPIGARQSAELPLNLKDSRCGKISFSIERLKVYDLFGLTYHSALPGVRGSVVVLPNLFPLAVSLGTGGALDKDGTDYSTEKPGYDVSEPFGIREYIPGDSLKNIHWKLTRKLDRLIVREAGLPLENSLLILYETGTADSAKRPSPSVCDAMAEVFISLIQSLIADRIPHFIGWQDQNSGAFVRYSLQSEEEISGVLEKILAAGQQEDEFFCYEHYIQNFMACDFSHVVYITARPPKDIRLFAPKSRVTVLLCQDEERPESIDEQTDVQVIPFYPAGAEQDLYSIVV